MALSRWSHSRWYIYEQDNGLVVMGDGYITLEELNTDFDKTMNKFRYYPSKEDSADQDNCSELDFLELKMYVKSWKDMQNSNDKDVINQCNNKIHQLRKNGVRRFYLMFGDFDGFLNYWNEDLNHKDKFIKISKKEKSSFIYVDSLNLSKVKILSFDKINKFDLVGVWNVSYEYKNSKNKNIIDQKKCFISDFLSIENPLIVGESYLYNKESGMFYNEEKQGYSELKNKHIDSIISMLELSKIK